MNETRYCDNGCGYKLPADYAPHETTCLNEQTNTETENH